MIGKDSKRTNSGSPKALSDFKRSETPAYVGKPEILAPAGKSEKQTPVSRPEILAPAGNFEKLRAALDYGADAVYLAGTDFGMRATDNFTDDELDKAIKLAHSMGRRVYITVNIMPRDDEYPALVEYLGLLAALKPDAVIVADLGVLSLAREICAPHGIDLHVSTQASVVSSHVCKEYARLGASRVILARELSLRDIRRIKDAVGDSLELEAFVHGAMCVSYSGMCLLSENMTGRDANHGKCTQPCRWRWRAEGIEKPENEEYVSAVSFREEKRPDDYYTLLEDRRYGSFVLSSRDMCMIEHLDKLIEAGVSSLKIEGRMKSAYYAAAVTNAYRMALDDVMAGRPFNKKLYDEVSCVSHREYSTGHFFGGEDLTASELSAVRATPGVCTNDGYIREKAYLATVVYYDKAAKVACLVQRNKLKVGDKCELLSPGKTGVPFEIVSITDTDGFTLDSAPHPGMYFSVPMSIEAKPGDILRGVG